MSDSEGSYTLSSDIEFVDESVRRVMEMEDESYGDSDMVSSLDEEDAPDGEDVIDEADLMELEEVDEPGLERQEAAIGEQLSQIVSPQAAPAPARAFRLRAKKFFLTYPQCDSTPATVLAAIRAHEPYADKIERILVASELHESGDPHIHVALWLTTRFSYSDQACFDWVTGQHGSYEVLKGAVNKVAKYLTKDSMGTRAWWSPDGSFDPSVYLNSRVNRRGYSFEAAAKRLKNGESISDVNEDAPGFVLQHLPKMQDYVQFIDMTAPQTNLPLPGDLTDSVLALEEPIKTIGSWIASNVSPNRDHSLPFGTKQLWIHGPTQLGKTSMILALERYFDVYYPPPEQFYDDYEDGRYDLICFDEFAGGKTIQFLNTFITGARCPLRRKGRARYLKKRNIPVLFIANQTPSEVYHGVAEKHPWVMSAFERRLEIVSLSAQDPLFPIVDIFGGQP